MKRKRLNAVDDNTGEELGSALCDFTTAEAAVWGPYHWEEPKIKPRRLTFPLFSWLDPWNSIQGGLEYIKHRRNAHQRLLKLLYANDQVWLPKDAILDVGGSCGDKRFRELRDAGWPVEEQSNGGGAWYYRIVLPQVTPPTVRRIRRRFT